MRFLKENVLVSNQELADWLCIGLNTLYANKQKYLEELKSYCDFVEEKKKVRVKKVYYPVYKKDKVLRIALDNLDKYWASSGLDLPIFVCRRIYKDFEKEIGVDVETFYVYVLYAMNILFGTDVEFQMMVDRMNGID